MSELEIRPAPTVGLRVEVVEMPAERDHGAYAVVGVPEMKYCQSMASSQAEWTQAGIDATYINWLIETDEKRREQMTKLHSGSQDILVDMGDMSRVSLDIPLDADYESMTEDIIQNVNHIVLQGIEPIKALFSMSQAFAIVLGYALRANMPFEIAKALITQVMKSATASEKMVRIITKQ